MFANMGHSSAGSDRGRASSHREKCRDKVGPLQTKPSFAPLTQHENKVETGTMEHHEKNQHDCADAERHQRF